jgi:hypothetical protein
LRGRGIAGRRHEARRGQRRADGRDCLFDIGRFAPIDGDLGAVLGQRVRDGVANSLGGTGNQRAKPLASAFWLAGAAHAFRDDQASAQWQRSQPLNTANIFAGRTPMANAVAASANLS